MRNRPPRVAVALSPGAPTRTKRRALRLLSNKWGGTSDIILPLDPGLEIAGFELQMLRLADPDFILVIDSRLGSYDWDLACSRAGVQPFRTIRFTEGMESRGGSNNYVVEGPIAQGDERDVPEVMDVDALGFDWQLATLLGMVPRGAPFRLKREWSEGDPIGTILEERERFLTTSAAEVPWMFSADADDFVSACRFWNVRALGGQPYWLSNDELTDAEPPELLRGSTRLVLFASGETPEVSEACRRWTSSARRVSPPPAELREILVSGEPSFSRAISTVHPHRGRLVFPSPPPPSLGERTYSFVPGVASIRFQSSDPRSPDGVILPVTARARELVAEGEPNVRITRTGIAQLTSLASSEVFEYPDVGFFDAVESAVSDGGVRIEQSDKGRYQQRALVLAGGLRFLAWVLSQPQSLVLLKLFQTYHLAGSPPAGYRRAVTYEELRAEVINDLASRRKRLRSDLRRRAHDWVARWSEEMTRRGLLRVGFVLRCGDCAARVWYAAEDVGQQFECARCHARHVIPAQTVPSFQLNEAFFQFLEHHGEVVTLTLARFREAAASSFLYVPEAVLSGQAHGEVDALALLDGRLAAVEAKSNNQLDASDVTKIRQLARRTRLDFAVFATTSREKPLCAQLKCDECRAQFGQFHRDYAWRDGAKARIEALRNALPTTGVGTFCFEVLGATDERELDLYSGGRIPRGTGYDTRA